MNEAMPKIQALQSQLRKMERRGELNPQVIEYIDELKDEIQRTGEGIFSELDRLERYKTYFAIRTKLDILKNMKDRIKKSKEENDNPKVIEDSLSILDSLQDYSELSPKKIKEYSFTDFLKIQKTAKRLNLFPDVEEIKKEVNKTSIEDANRFFDNIRNEISA